jgi:hypothetical protein
MLDISKNPAIPPLNIKNLMGEGALKEERIFIN